MSEKEKMTRRDKKILARKFAGVIALVALIVCACAVYSPHAFGWFAHRTDVAAKNARVNASADFFELAVSGDQVSSYAADSDLLRFLGSDEYGGFEKLSATDPSHPAIFCNLVNETLNSSETDLLAPGSFGKVSFDIVPKKTLARQFSVSFDYFPLDDSTGSIQIAAAEDLQSLQTLLSGHILFFNSRSALVNGGYYYSDRINDDAFIFDLDDVTPTTVNGEEHYKVEFYWIWSITFSQLAYRQDDPRLHTHALFQSEAERLEMIAHVKEHPEEFFRNLDPHVNLNRASFESYYFVELSDAYNVADQYIGEKAHSLALRINVEPYQG